MRATVTIEKDALDILLKETKSKSKASAVRIAIDDYLRRKKIEKIRAMKSKLKFDMTADEIRHREGGKAVVSDEEKRNQHTSRRLLYCSDRQ